MASAAAPDRLEFVRQFVNTIEIDQGKDPLAGPDDLEAWAQAEGYGRPAPEAAADLRGFREALRAALEANAGEGDREAAWAMLAPYASRVRFSLEPVGGALALRPSGASADALFGAVFAAIYDALAAGTWARLKVCRKSSCRWAFYDRSKNGSGAWCSMAVCGNRVKAQKRRLSRKNAPEK